MAHEIQEFTASNALSYYPEAGLKDGSSHARLERPDWVSLGDSDSFGTISYRHHWTGARAA